MDLCQVGLATGADVDDVLCDGAVPIKGSHPGQHLAPLRVVSDDNIEWSIRHLCVQKEDDDKGTLESVADGSHGRPEMQWHAALAETHRRQWKEYLVLDKVRGVVIVAITPDQVQPPMTSVQ